MTFDLNGRTALVTGANRGIGAAFVDALIAGGARKVYAAVRRPESARQLVDRHGDKVVPLAFDLTDPGTIEAAARTAGDVELVINNGGVLKPAGPLTPDAFDTMAFEFDVNVRGLMRTAQAFAPVLKANGGGAFVQLNSVASLKCFPDFATYCMSKAAAYSYTQALKFKLAEQGTAVFSVHPGPIQTDMAADAGLHDMAEPASKVADALLAAFRSGDFHVFPDSMARQMWETYEPFGRNVVEPAMAE